MKFEVYEYSIAAHYLPALINGDYTGMSDTEEKEFTDWLESTDRRITHWDCDTDNAGFARCEVSGLMADCVIVSGFMPI